MKIYAIERVDVGDEDPYAISFDLEALKQWFKKHGNTEYPAYIVEGDELTDKVFHVSYQGNPLFEWDVERQEWLTPDNEA